MLYDAPFYPRYVLINLFAWVLGNELNTLLDVLSRLVSNGFQLCKLGG